MKPILLIATTSILFCSMIDINSAYYHQKLQLSTSMKNQVLFSHSESADASNSRNNSVILSSKDNEQLSRLQRMKPNLAGYTRVDESFLDDNVKDLFKLSNHALHDTLNGPNMVEVYDIFKKNDSEEIVCLIKFGKSLNGYPGIVHGGITALLFDNTFGWVFLALKAPHGVTANLNINYRRPVKADSWVVLTAKIDKKEGRKLFMTAEMADERGNLLADSTTLFVSPKQRD